MMRYPTLLATLVATLLSVNLAVAQNPFEDSDNFKSANDSGQLDSSNDSIDLAAFQQNAYTATVFETEAESTPAPLVANHANAQHRIVSNTLTLIGVALVISVIAIGIFVYSTRRDRFGELRRPESDW